MRTNTQDTSQCVGKFQVLLTARKDEHFLKPINNMANVTKPKRKVATTLLNVDLPNRLQALQIRRNKIKADAEPIVSIADLHNEAIEMLLRKEQL
jgi:hypothetical protein